MLGRLPKVLLYLGLLFGSIAFVWQSIEDYTKGTTSYTEAHEPLSFKDLPTFTICLNFYVQNQKWQGIEYGQHFTIDVTPAGARIEKHLIVLYLCKIKELKLDHLRFCLLIEKLYPRDRHEIQTAFT